MDQIDQDDDIELALASFGLDAIDLVVVSVDKRDPGALVFLVSTLCLVDDRGRVFDHAHG
ncbi:MULTISPECIES: hypothetical protein [Ferrimicrobium]|uniref:hypothetical protein n=1 Tax=Ferrimicrobium sp. TaxID=2926050 RepID=UPI0023F50E41|nr:MULTISPECIES: hypothetical protein [Ferrimicrobium]